MSPTERLLAKAVVTEHGLIWNGAVNSSGYGVMYVRTEARKKIFALVHRYFYEANKGPVQAGFDVHHTCHLRRCLTHLEPIDSVTNRRDQWRSNRARRFRIKSERMIYRGIVATKQAA